MKRTVREIIADYRDGREVMSLGEFGICLKAINDNLKAACLFPDGSRESKKHFRIADDICLAVEDCFADRNSNLVNWFRRDPCEFHHPVTGRDVTIEVERAINISLALNNEDEQHSDLTG